MAGFFSNNLKSKTCPELYRRIEKRKRWVNFAIVFTFIFGAVVAKAQLPKKVARLGVIRPGSAAGPILDSFRHGLRELGYVEGKDVVIEWRNADGKFDRLPALAAELERLNVDIIVTAGPQTTRPAKQATSTIPIVMAQDPDPVGNGLVASLARPGGNITGFVQPCPGVKRKTIGAYEGDRA